jgi:phosphoglycerate dehydrogenase-like enzyme
MLRVHLATDGDSASITPTPDRDGDPFLDALTPLVGEFATLHRGPTDEIGRDADVLVGSRVTPGVLDRAIALRTIIVPWAGIPRPLVHAVAESGRTDVAIRNIHHNAASAAETGLALLLTAARGVHRMDPVLRAGDWRPRYAPRPARRLEGGRAVVLGRGAIGSRLARGLDGLGMSVATFGRPESGDRWPASELAARIHGADVLMIAIPAGTDTDRLVDGPVLDAITGGIVVNIARASVVDEDALYERLADGRLFAAGLDVWWRVPNGPEEHPTTIPSHRPFHELDNVAMTPHVGGGLGEPGIERARAEAIAGVLAELARDPASTHG